MSATLTSSTPLHQFVVQGARSTPHRSSVQAPVLDSAQLLQIAIEELADGLMVITPQGEIVAANRCARQICYHLMSSCEFSNVTSALRLPGSILQQCQQLLQQGELQPGQKTVPEFELTLNDSIHLRVRVRWLEAGYAGLDSESPSSFLLLTLEERNRSLSKIRQYNLSDREQEVWKLRLQGYSYHEIANKLYITINTVKKHTKNIRAKQRLFEDTNLLSGLS
jgi:DNA-binding CsgD family transcriptional regulator